MLERVQKRATKMVQKLTDVSYKKRLNECGLTTLETRRLRGGQIEVFKILNGYENIDINMFSLVLSVYWPTLLVESNGQGWVRMLLGC